MLAKEKTVNPLALLDLEQHNFSSGRKKCGSLKYDEI
jgi:hypothetical protein